MTRPILLAAGGTGGHMFPAEALATELAARGHRLALITDRRGGAFGDGAVATYRIAAAGIGGSLLARLRGGTALALGMLQARRLVRRLAPAAAVGFGGYPSVPTMLAASWAGVPSMLHEQNAVLGRANRLLAPRVDYIATSFATVQGVSAADRDKVVQTGNPVRAAIAALADEPYQAPTGDERMRILVLGGSQGASVFSDVVPAGVAELPRELQRRLEIVQQCRPEDLEVAQRAYTKSSVTAELATFFDDVPARLAAAHLVICRAGASTVSEISAAGRPAILVPYPHATDDHQTANACALDKSGGAWLTPQDAFTPAALATRLEAFLTLQATLGKAAACVRRVGQPNAARQLADLVETLLRDKGRVQGGAHTRTDLGSIAA
jgi:UDP-N-acetylglucosamine--N-acetylmuramyl-(pentapeptide) pyrophosphoryl-undecaprenol N-acetylglucosamine transferase